MEPEPTKHYTIQASIVTSMIVISEIISAKNMEAYCVNEYSQLSRPLHFQVSPKGSFKDHMYIFMGFGTRTYRIDGFRLTRVR